MEQVSILTGTDCKPKTAVPDRGYRGCRSKGWASQCQGRSGITGALKALIRWRSAIEPAIGHMKVHGRLARNSLKGALGDALHAVMCGVGHNLPMILAKLRLLRAQMGITRGAFLASLSPPAARLQFHWKWRHASKDLNEYNIFLFRFYIFILERLTLIY